MYSVEHNNAFIYFYLYIYIDPHVAFRVQYAGRPEGVIL